MISLIIAWLIIGLVAVVGMLLQPENAGFFRVKRLAAALAVLICIAMGPVFYVWCNKRKGFDHG